MFAVSKVFFPINTDKHWILMVAFMESKTLKCYDSNGGENLQVFKDVEAYLKKDHLHKKGTPSEDWIRDRNNEDVPKQTNGRQE
jgi:Ulp1 family protease